MPSIRGLLEDTRSALLEDQALTAILGALGGIGLAVLASSYGPDSSADSFTVTVDQARTSLLSALALVFTALSIVLALTALTTQNMATKFSPRLLRMGLRGSGNKWVLTVFAFTSSFILSTLVLMRDDPNDSTASPLSMTIAVLLLVVTGVMIVWYIDGTMQSMRVDRAIRWVGRRVRQAAEAVERSQRNDVIVGELEVERPAGAVDLVAAEDGYVVEVDTGRLERLATSSDGLVVVDFGIGRAATAGERVGWVSGELTGDDLRELSKCLTIAHSRDPDTDVGYTIAVLVDIALMALSPAVNDPRTGVEVVEKLTELLTGLAGQKLGTRVRLREDGSTSVVARDSSVGDYLDLAGRQILLYGASDSLVTSALLRLGRQCERCAPNDRDRRMARDFAAEVEAVAAGHA